MAVAAEQLIGRTVELLELDRAVAELKEKPAAVALVGEPGIGKTRLLAELGARADSQGLIVLSGSASELERELPFWIFVDALDEYVQALDPRRLRSIPGDQVDRPVARLRVLADAFIVRLTVVPAVMALLGRSAWRLPRRVERVMPDVDIEGEKLLESLHPARP